MENEYQWLLTMPALVGISILGMVSHFFKKQIKGETFSDIRMYFKNHLKSTIVALISTVIGTLAYYMSLSTGQPADILAALGIGYTFDSMFNKWDKAA